MFGLGLCLGVNLDKRVTNGCVIIGIGGDPGAIALSI